jgi:enoyl-CoA hydratase/carnithine racemase
MSEGGELVTYRTADEIAVISLNRPEKRNAINAQLSSDLQRHLAAADADDGVSVIVLRGEGKSFCAGHDISRSDPEREKWRRHAIRQHKQLSAGLKLATAIWDLPKPVVASVQGHALGVGCILTMLCDLTIAAENALFGEPEIRFAAPATAMMMPWLIGAKRARELIYMGDMIDAAEARELGIVNRVVPTEELEQATMKYARRLAKIGPETLSCAKVAINRVMEIQGIRNGWNSSVDIIAPLYATETPVDTAFREKVSEIGLGPALKWRASDFE